MNKTAWLVVLGMAWIVSGCTPPESGKPADQEKKAAPTAKEQTSAAPAATEPVAKEPAAKAAEPTAVLPESGMLEPAKTPETGEKAKTEPQAKGSVLGAMGKAILKASAASNKSKDLKAADEAPVGK